VDQDSAQKPTELKRQHALTGVLENDATNPRRSTFMVRAFFLPATAQKSTHVGFRENAIRRASPVSQILASFGGSARDHASLSAHFRSELA
jgi:hypothetical protein